jgi:hypothetical protein
MFLEDSLEPKSQTNPLKGNPGMVELSTTSADNGEEKKTA